MKKKPVSVHRNVRYSEIFPKGCPDIYPGKEKPVRPGLLRVETSQYVAFSDGVKRIYTNEDRVRGYGNSEILNPNSVSYINLFINAMLQPPSLYHVQEGVLTLYSEDIPQQGVAITLQFISIFND